MTMLKNQTIHGAAGRSRQRSQVERDTPIVPRAVAEGVWQEASVWLGEPLPRRWIAQLAARANTVYAKNPQFRRLLRRPGDTGRDWLWAFTRHWLAALICKHRPALYSRLPASFSVGRSLPQKQAVPARKTAITDTQNDRFLYDLSGLTEDEIKILGGTKC